MIDLPRASLAELLDALAARDLSCLELMQATLERIDATHERLNAIVSRIDPEEALAAARRADDNRAQGRAGALEGVPLGVKDLEDVAGMVTSKGSVPFADNVAGRDSTQVSLLRQAGAIPIAKTNTPEFGFTALTKNQLFGVTRSPWGSDRTPGGSSGGSAALLAGGVLPLVTASDGGGSIRIPASFVGAVGLKPSYGRVSLGPLETWDTSMTAVYGPLTRTVEDAALVLDLIAGQDPSDPTSLPLGDTLYRSGLEDFAGERLRLAYSRDLGYAVVQSDIAERVDEAVEVLRGLGHTVEEIQGGPPELGGFWGELVSFELAGRLLPRFAGQEDRITRAFLHGLENARAMTPEKWAEGQQQRAALVSWAAELFSHYDALVTPTLSFDPPPARGPFPSETDGRPQRPTGAASFTIPFNLSWHPAISVRAGLSAAGLPVGMQIVGPHHREDVVLGLAYAFERERPWHPEWPVEL